MIKKCLYLCTMKTFTCEIANLWFSVVAAADVSFLTPQEISHVNVQA